MFKTPLKILALLAIAFSAFVFSPFGQGYYKKYIGYTMKQADASMKNTGKLPVQTVIIDSGGKTSRIQAEIAAKKGDHIQGLMHRTSMGRDEGMLFIYPKVQEITMWMQNTILPLDMIFISAKGEITHISYSAQPYSLDTISSNGLAKAVLEVNAGVAEELNLKIGDMVYHSAFSE